ncbi:MAG: hypothetical protein IJS61_05880 [Firmicutes bacterium]|nr:hypothetical protein [Bacillota bacterium]
MENGGNQSGGNLQGCFWLFIVVMMVLGLLSYCSKNDDEYGKSGLPKWQEEKIERDFERHKAWYGS